MLKLEALSAGHGDCLWIEYGHATSPKRILIDGGARGTYKRALQSKLANAGGQLELLVVTHIDGDHITGILDLLADPTSNLHAKDIWFNGYRHLPDEVPTLGPVQGEKLTDFLVKPGINWNGAFNREAVVIPDGGDLPRKELDGGLTLTLLSPTIEGLADLKPVWEREVRKAGLDPNATRPEEIEPVEFGLLDGGPPDINALAAEPFLEDNSEANGSSIALLLEYEGQRLLLAADAHPHVLQSSVDRLRGTDKLPVAACKLPHHGSKGNVSRKFLERLDCPIYLISTNGAYYKHPDREAVARVISWGGKNTKLVFNYRTEYTSIWDSKPLKNDYGYSVDLPAGSSTGTALQFSV